jgi:uncharacterized protein
MTDAKPFDEEIELTIDLGPSGSGSQHVSAILQRPPDARWIYIVGHGAGAGMRNDFLAGMTTHLAERAVAILRYQFPYLEAGRKELDPPALLEHTVRAAVAEAARLAPDLPLLAGGQSLGALMTSQAQAAAPLPGVRGLVFLAFPLHWPGKPSIERAEHLPRVELPMLFLQGTRDELTDLALLEPVLRPLRNAELLLIDGADHLFRVPASSGRTTDDVFGELAAAVVAFASRVAA